MNRVIFTLILLAVLVCPAFAYTTNQLKADCDAYLTEQANPSPSFSSIGAAISSNRCSGYVIGWGDAIAGYGFFGDDGQYYTLGFADGVTPDQVVKVFVKWVNANPASLNKSVNDSLLLALNDAGLMGKTKVAKPIVPSNN